MNAATKTKLPKGLPQAIAWEIARKRKEGNSVWVLHNPRVPVPAALGHAGSDCRLWIMFYKMPNHRKLHGYQWEQWDHHSYTTPVTRTSDWEWNRDYAHKQWEALVEDGWVRIV